MLKNSLVVKNGEYGSQHDPYAYEELTFTNLKGESMTWHRGLMEYVILPNGDRKSYYGLEGEPKFLDPMFLFAAFLNITPKAVQKLVIREYESYELDPMGSPSQYI